MAFSNTELLKLTPAWNEFKESYHPLVGQYLDVVRLASLNIDVNTPAAVPDVVHLTRKLDILSASSKLYRFHTKRLGEGKETLSEDIQRMRQHKITLKEFIKYTDPTAGAFVDEVDQRHLWATPDDSKLKRILFEWFLMRKANLASGSEHSSKILVFTNTSLRAWHMDITLNDVQIHTRVLHSHLSDSERAALCARFNDPSSALAILICPYSADLEGVNLHGACHTLFLESIGTTSTDEFEAIRRIVNVGQPFECTVHRLGFGLNWDMVRHEKLLEKMVAVITASFSGAVVQANGQVINNHAIEACRFRLDSDAGRALGLRLANEAQPRLDSMHDSVVNHEPSQERTRIEAVFERAVADVRARYAQPIDLEVEEADVENDQMGPDEGSGMAWEESLPLASGFVQTALHRALSTLSRQDRAHLDAQFVERLYAKTFPRGKIWEPADLNDPLCLERVARLLAAKNLDVEDFLPSVAALVPGPV